MEILDRDNGVCAGQRFVSVQEPTVSLNHASDAIRLASCIVLLVPYRSQADINNRFQMGIIGLLSLDGHNSPDTTRLIVLRGNSASGKSTIAAEIRSRFGRGIAIVSQDYLRRIVLKQRDCPGGVNIGLIDWTDVRRCSAGAGAPAPKGASPAPAR